MKIASIGKPVAFVVAAFVALAVTSSVKGDTVFQENFEGFDTAGGPVDITTGNSNFTTASVSGTGAHVKSAVADPGTVFGSNNNYLDIHDAGNGIPTLIAQLSSPITGGYRLSFEFNQPSATSNYIAFRMSSDAPHSAANTSTSFVIGANAAIGSLTTGGNDAGTGAIFTIFPTEDVTYTLPGKHRIDVIGTIGGSAFSYAAGDTYGEGTLAPREYDIWIDGVLHDELKGLKSWSSAPDSLSYFTIHGNSGSQIGRLSIDNILVETINPVPEPGSIGLLAMGSIVALGAVLKRRTKVRVA